MGEIGREYAMDFLVEDKMMLRTKIEEEIQKNRVLIYLKQKVVIL